MAGMLMGGVMDDITAGFSEMGKGFSKGKTDAKKSHLKGKAEKSENVFFGYSSISFQKDGQAVGIAREAESMFTKNLERYAKVDPKAKECGFLVVKCRPLKSNPEMSTDEMMIRSGDHIGIWADSGAGKYGKVSSVLKYLIFESDECLMDEEYNGSMTFRLMKAGHGNRDPLVWGDSVAIACTNRDNGYLDIDKKGYVRVVSVTDDEAEPPRFTLRRSEKPVRISKVGPPIPAYSCPKPPQDDFITKVGKVFE